MLQGVRSGPTVGAMDQTPRKRGRPPGSRQLDNALGRRIAEARVRRELTQEALAALLGVSRVTLAYWEGGQFEPDLARIRAIAAALNVTPSWLAFGDAAP